MLRTMLKSKIHRATVTQAGDLVLLISYGQMNDAEARAHEPRIVHVDTANRIIELGADPAAAAAGMAGDLVRGDLTLTV